MVMATPSGTPAATRLVTAVWRVLWNTKPPCFRPIGKPAALHAAAHAFLKSLAAVAADLRDRALAVGSVEEIGAMQPTGCPELLHQLQRPPGKQMVPQPNEARPGERDDRDHEHEARAGRRRAHVHRRGRGVNLPHGRGG